MTLNWSARRIVAAMSASNCSPPETKPNRALPRLLLLALLACCSLSVTGCLNPSRPHALGNLVDGAYSNFRERVWANRAFNLQYRHMPRKFREHFRKGFIEGYCNVCNGGDGYSPAMPPRDYWGYEYQSAEGAECVSAWFDGFPEGVAAARKSNAGKNADMYISNMIERAVQQQNEGVRLASEVEIRRAITRTADLPAELQTPKSESEAPPAPQGSEPNATVPGNEAGSKPATLLTPLAPLTPAEPSMIIGQGDF